MYQLRVTLKNVQLLNDLLLFELFKITLYVICNIWTVLSIFINITYRFSAVHFNTNTVLRIDIDENIILIKVVV